MGFVLYPPTKETFLLLARFGLVATLSLSAIGLIDNPSNAPKEVVVQSTDAPVISPAVQNKVRALTLNTMHPELRAQFKTRKAGSIKFWEAVSWCETNHNWNDGGYYAGGLGMAKSAWEGFGGREFSRSPKGATKEEQIIVANRLAFFGFQTKNVFKTLDDKLNNRPFFRPAIGWRSSSNWGKNCVNWKTRKPNHERFTEAGMLAWKKSRGES